MKALFISFGLNTVVVFLSLHMIFKFRYVFPVIYDKHEKLVDLILSIILSIYIPLSSVFVGIYVVGLFTIENIKIPVITMFIYFLLVRVVKKLADSDASKTLKCGGYMVLYCLQGITWFIYYSVANSITQQF